MKKNIIVFILIPLMVLGCSDEFTEGINKGALSDAALANADGVNLLLTAAYSALDGNVGAAESFWHASGDNWWMDVLTDDAHKGSTNGDQPTLHDLQTFNNWSASNDYFLGKWLALYVGVNRANSVIALAKTITDTDVSQQIAEARFIRAHFNFELSRMYRNVAYVDEVIAVEDPDQSNPGPLWDEVEADFQFAIDNLPDEGLEGGRANAMVARAYKGKAHLYQKEWSEAETLFDAVIASGNYMLNKQFADNFNVAGKNGDEVVFSIQFEANDGATLNANGNLGGTLNFPGGGPFESCCGFYQPTQDLANAFKTTNGLPEINTYNDSDIDNDQGIESDDAFTTYTGNLDPRIDYTIGRRGIDYNGWGEHVGFNWVRAQPDAGPYLPKKNVYKKGEDATQGTGGWGNQSSGLHYNIIRYADVLLMAAETKAEQGKTSDAMALVNEVRQRAISMTTVKDVNDATVDAANYDIQLYTAGTFTNPIDAIRFERRLELSMEGHRYFDLVRWGIAESVINTFFTNEKRTVTSLVTSTFQDKHNVFPVPLRAIDVAENLEQNPEWTGN